VNVGAVLGRGRGRVSIYPSKHRRQSRACEQGDKRAQGGLIWGHGVDRARHGPSGWIRTYRIGPRLAIGLSRDCSALCRQMGRAGGLAAYRDVRPGLDKVCLWPETKGVKPGDRYTKGANATLMLRA